MKNSPAVVYVDGVYKVYRNGKQLRLSLRTGKRIAVQFEHREAAEAYVRIYRIISAFDRVSPSA